MKSVLLSALALAGLAGSSPAADVRYVKQCYVDANGFERCRTVPVVVETAPVPVSVSMFSTSESPCPCVGAKGFGTSAYSSSPSPVVVLGEIPVRWVVAARASGVWFPRVRAFFSGVRENRAERVAARQSACR